MVVLPAGVVPSDCHCVLFVVSRVTGVSDQPAGAAPLVVVPGVVGVVLVPAI